MLLGAGLDEGEGEGDGLGDAPEGHGVFAGSNCPLGQTVGHCAWLGAWTPVPVQVTSVVTVDAEQPVAVAKVPPVQVLAGVVAAVVAGVVAAVDALVVQAPALFAT